MADLWWFKSLGEEFGPVSHKDLVEAVKRGILASNDAVRGSQQAAWQRADSVPGLFGTDQDCPPPSSEWMVEVLGETLGPVPLTQLAAMVRDGHILPTDRIRHVASEVWQPARLVMQFQESRALDPQANNNAQDESDCETFEAKRSKPSCDLESLILEVLSKPFDPRDKPTLVELGLDQVAHATSATHVLGADNVTASGGALAPAAAPARSIGDIGRRWLRGVRGLDVTPCEQSAQHMTSETNETTILPAVERNYSAPGVSTAESRARSSERHGVHWLEAMAIVCVLALAFQIFPGLWDGLIESLDVRTWTLQRMIIANIAVVVGLVCARVWLVWRSRRNQPFDGLQRSRNSPA